MVPSKLSERAREPGEGVRAVREVVDVDDVRFAYDEHTRSCVRDRAVQWACLPACLGTYGQLANRRKPEEEALYRLPAPKSGQRQARGGLGLALVQTAIWAALGWADAGLDARALVSAWPPAPEGSAKTTSTPRSCTPSLPSKCGLASNASIVHEVHNMCTCPLHSLGARRTAVASRRRCVV